MVNAVVKIASFNPSRVYMLPCQPLGSMAASPEPLGRRSVIALKNAPDFDAIVIEGVEDLIKCRGSGELFSATVLDIDPSIEEYLIPSSSDIVRRRSGGVHKPPIATVPLFLTPLLAHLPKPVQKKIVKTISIGVSVDGARTIINRKLREHNVVIEQEAIPAPIPAQAPELVQHPPISVPEVIQSVADVETVPEPIPTAQEDIQAPVLALPEVAPFRNVFQQVGALLDPYIIHLTEGTLASTLSGEGPEKLSELEEDIYRFSDKIVELGEAVAKFRNPLKPTPKKAELATPAKDPIVAVRKSRQKPDWRPTLPPRSSDSFKPKPWN